MIFTATSFSDITFDSGKSFYQSTEDESAFKVFIPDHLSPEYAIHKDNMASNDVLNNTLYDADDEVDANDQNNNEKTETFYDSSTDELLFHFCQDNQGTIYTLNRALSIIKQKPKLTHRMHEDSADSSDESEFEIIESAESFCSDSSCGKRCSRMKIPDINICCHNYSEDEDIQVLSFHLPDRMKLGKVKSLPNLRFPLKRHPRTKRSYYSPENSKNGETDSSMDNENKHKTSSNFSIKTSEEKISLKKDNNKNFTDLLNKKPRSKTLTTAREETQGRFRIVSVPDNRIPREILKLNENVSVIFDYLNNCNANKSFISGEHF